MKTRGDFLRAASAGLVFCALLGAVLLLVHRWDLLGAASDTSQNATAASSGESAARLQKESQKRTKDGPRADASQGAATVGSSGGTPAAANPNRVLELRDPASLTAQERQKEIEEWETKLELEEAIERLNAGRVTGAEREEYGRVFARLVALKKVGLRDDLDALSEQVANIARAHEERLAAVGLQARPRNQ